MMKSKFMAGLVASLICLVFVVVAAIILTNYTHGDPADRMLKVVAFATIGIWVALYAWFKPKDKNQGDQDPNSPPAKKDTYRMRP